MAAHIYSYTPAHIATRIIRLTSSEVVEHLRETLVRLGRGVEMLCTHRLGITIRKCIYIYICICAQVDMADGDGEL
jgi:hypothetical protein